MFYHVRIDYFDKKLKVNQTLYEYDYSSKDEVLGKVVTPYLGGKRIIFNGTVLNAEDGRQIRIYETDRDIKNMVAFANSNVSPGILYVYSNDDLINDSDYSREITKEITQSALDVIEQIKAEKCCQQEPVEKQPLLFISHSSADEELITGLVEMLRTIGFNNKNLFCSSVPGYDIPEGEDIYDFLWNTSVSKLTSSPSIQYAITVTSIAQPVAHSPKIGQYWTLLQRSCKTF